MRGAFLQSGWSGGGPWGMCCWPVALHPAVVCVCACAHLVTGIIRLEDFPKSPKSLTIPLTNIFFNLLVIVFCVSFS